MLESKSSFGIFGLLSVLHSRFFPNSPTTVELQESPEASGEKSVKTRTTKQSIKKGQLPSKTPVQWTPNTVLWLLPLSTC